MRLDMKAKTGRVSYCGVRNVCAHTTTYNAVRLIISLDSINMRMRNLLIMLALIIHNLVIHLV
jgi:hypothetical protein